MTRPSSLDEDYTTGDLSVFPEALDDKDVLYEAKNNAITNLKQSLAYNGKQIIVDNADAFPATGLLRLSLVNVSYPEPELVYYGKKQGNVFSELNRGFAGSAQNEWPAASTFVANAVFAEHHNAVKDAIINMETFLGTENLPAEGSINRKVQELEAKYLCPCGVFRAFPRQGAPNLTVKFHNLSGQHITRCVWDFGDGTTSLERSPTHTYTAEGTYTIKLNVITVTGSQGVTTKNNYIVVSNDNIIPFAYANPSTGSTATVFEFVDQTDGDISERYWMFGDGTSTSVTDSNKHSIKHTYTSSGTYEPSLVVVFKDQKYKRVLLNSVTVTA